MRIARTLALAAAVAVAVSACAQAAPAWTFTPPSPSPSPGASAAPSAAASAAPSAGASAAPSAGASAAPSGAASGAPSAAPSGGGGTGTVIQIIAAGVQFDQAALTAPANAPFQITLTNNDSGIQHNVAITQNGAVTFAGEYVTGPGTITYDIPALPAGSYTFLCQLHPNMTGTLTVQ